MGFCSKNLKTVKLETEGKIIEQISNCNYLGYLISNDDDNINIKAQRYNIINGIIKDHFEKFCIRQQRQNYEYLTLFLR
jgi:hypothetical protein